MPAILKAGLLLCMVGSLATPAALYGQSLGEAEVLSSLGDPIEVEIPLSDWHNIDLKRVQVVGANRQQYEAFKLRYMPIHDSMSFNLVGPNSSGEVKILVSSRRPVAEPYIELLLSLRWPEGSTLREYVLLFDPPRLRDKTPAAAQVQQPAAALVKPDPALAVRDPAPAVQTRPKPVEPRVEAVKPEADLRKVTKSTIDTSKPQTDTPRVEKPRVEAANTQTAPPRLAEPLNEKSTPPADQPKAPEVAARMQYRVKSTDSLWSIARQFQPSGIGTNSYQFMLALFELNRTAFLDGNLAMLKADAQLEIPTARDVVSLNAGSAQQIFERRWREALVNGANTPPAEAIAISGSSGSRGYSKPAEAQPPEPARQSGVERVESKPPESILTPAQSTLANSPANIPPEPSVPTKAPVPAALPVSTVVAPAAPKSIAVSPPASGTVTAPVKAVAPVQVASLAESAANPFLQQVTETAGAIQGMLLTRYQRLQALEQQILAMQSQLQQAQESAGSRRQAMEEMQAAATRKAVLLGLLAAGLIIAMGVMLKLAWQWNQDTKRLIAQRRR